MKHIVFLALFCWISVAHAGDVVDKGSADKVPDWAIGPLLVIPIGKIGNATKDDCVRLGTLQSKSLELFGRRFTLAKIDLAEFPMTPIAAPSLPRRSFLDITKYF